MTLFSRSSYKRLRAMQKEMDGNGPPEPDYIAPAILDRVLSLMTLIMLEVKHG